MGLFSEFENSCEVRNPSFSSTNDTVTYPASADSTIDLHWIRIQPDELDFSNETVAEYECNPDGDVTATIKKNAEITDTVTSTKYKVTESPQFYPLMNITKVKAVKLINKTNV